jgi:general secretion pathway protein J
MSPHLQKRRRTDGGFTLIEVLVALVVMSIVAGLSSQAVDGMVRTRNVVDEQSRRLVSLGTALAQWEQDLQSLLTDGPLPSIHFDGSRLRLIRRVPQGVQLVVWSLQQGTWQRWAAPPTTTESQLAMTWAQVPQMQGREPGHIKLAEDVTNAQSAADLVTSGVAASQGTGAGRALPNRERLPHGVRLVMTLQGAAGNGTITRDVLVPGGQP